MWAVVKEGIENEESILWSSYICNNELILRFILLENEKYYWKMRSAVGVLRGEDKFLCLSSGSICVLIIVFVVIKNIKDHK